MILHTDGACRGNPGPSSAGWVFFDEQKKVFGCGRLYLGRRTNNEAEYLAAALGLQAALDLNLERICLRADSELMIRQLTGVYQVRNPRIKPLYDTVISLARRLVGGCRFEHVRREYNVEADREANRALDEEPTLLLRRS